MLQRNATKLVILLEYENPRSFFHFMLQLYFPPNECPGLCRHRPQHSLAGKNKVAQNEKGKKFCGISYSKNMENFEAFAGTFHQA